ncbi:interleukin-15 receptor subunit alpha isoform X2 [Centroberyx affinis]|uniref:interleukin-15 receptor subunit alpha isoform X2 n=1 Tax=Centroberyx affinis TaxID=166261 RepID=UPI003A5C0604
MDLGSVSAFITTVCLLGVAPTSSDGVSCECPCPPPPQREQTQPAQAEKCCEQNGSFRYTCVPGYLRKAGTSNLIRCTQTTAGPQWSESKLQCIPDPRISTTTQTTTVTPSVSCECPCPPPPQREQTQPAQAEKCCEQNGSFFYTCVPGYRRKAGTSNLIRCTQTTAGPQWSESKLQCIPDPRISTTTQTTTTVTPSATAASPRSRTAQTPGVSAEEEHTAALPTSPGLLLAPTVQTQGPSAEPVRADRPTLGSTAAPSPTAIVSPGNNTTERLTGAIVPRVSAVAAVLLACGLMGVAVFWWKRRRSQLAGPPQTAEEQLPMNPEGVAPFGQTC